MNIRDNEINVSEYFWSFVKKINTCNGDEIYNSKEYQIFSHATLNEKRIVLDFDIVWDDESDIDLLGFPSNSLTYFYSHRYQFLYEEVNIMFSSLCDIYQIVVNIGQNNTNIYDINRITQKYAFRLERLRKCLEKINNFIHINDLVEKIGKM